jgi:hypothetical protein
MFKYILFLSLSCQAMEVAYTQRALDIPPTLENIVTRVMRTSENPVVYGSTDLDDDSIAYCLEYFVFKGYNTPHLHGHIKKSLMALKKHNPAAYDNLAFYTTYKLDKMFPFKNPVCSEELPGVYFARHELVKKEYWIPLSTSKLHMRIICNDSMAIVNQKKKRRKRLSPRFISCLKAIREDPQ